MGNLAASQPDRRQSSATAARGSIISLVIPALNEAQSLGSVLDRLPAGVYSQVIVVDNGSTDGTGAIALRHGATVVQEPVRGYGSACLSGIAHLNPDCDIVVFMDADASDDPQDVLRLVEPIQRDEADLVIGARRGPRVEKASLAAHQRMGNALVLWLIRILYGFRYTDLGPFRAIRRSSLAGLQMRDPNFGWTVEMQVKALRQRLRVREVQVGYRVRVGTSKISGSLKNSLLAGVKMIWKIAQLRIRT